MSEDYPPEECDVCGGKLSEDYIEGSDGELYCSEDCYNEAIHG